MASILVILIPIVGAALLAVGARRRLGAQKRGGTPDTSSTWQIFLGIAVLVYGMARVVTELNS